MKKRSIYHFSVFWVISSVKKVAYEYSLIYSRFIFISKCFKISRRAQRSWGLWALFSQIAEYYHLTNWLQICLKIKGWHQCHFIDSNIGLMGCLQTFQFITCFSKDTSRFCVAFRHYVPANLWDKALSFQFIIPSGFQRICKRLVSMLPRLN